MLNIKMEREKIENRKNKNIIKKTKGCLFEK